MNFFMFKRAVSRRSVSTSPAGIAIATGPPGEFKVEVTRSLLRAHDHECRGA
jgi:hypothetical protein